MSTLVFIHGWGCDSRLWDRVINYLNRPFISMDLGFYEALSPPPLSSPLPHDAILVGHSLGFAHGLSLHPWHSVVAINGFSRFTHCKDFPSGIAVRLLQRMIQRFDNDPHGVTTDFLQRCGMEPTQINTYLGKLCSAPLKKGLHQLMELDIRQTLAQLSIPMMILAGTEDQIVPPPMTKASFPSTSIHWYEGGDHLLPLSAPDWVASQLEALP